MLTINIWKIIRKSDHSVTLYLTVYISMCATPTKKHARSTWNKSPSSLSLNIAVFKRIGNKLVFVWENYIYYFVAVLSHLVYVILSFANALNCSFDSFIFSVCFPSIFCEISKYIYKIEVIFEKYGVYEWNIQYINFTYGIQVEHV